MRPLCAIFCIALALAGCRGTGSGLFGQITIPPPGTQPPGSLLADSSYYPNRASSPGATSAISGSALAAVVPAAPVSAAPVSTPQPEFTDRRGAAISRSNLGAPVRTSPPQASEEPIRIPSDPASVGTLAAVVPIRGIPTTDATSLFETIRSQLSSSRSSLAARSPASGFVEISQLPDASPTLRQAALSRQSLR